MQKILFIYNVCNVYNLQNYNEDILLVGICDFSKMELRHTPQKRFSIKEKSRPSPFVSQPSHFEIWLNCMTPRSQTIPLGTSFHRAKSRVYKDKPRIFNESFHRQKLTAGKSGGTFFIIISNNVSTL